MGCSSVKANVREPSAVSMLTTITVTAQTVLICLILTVRFIAANIMRGVNRMKCEYCGSDRHKSLDCSIRKWQAYLTGESDEEPKTPLHIIEEA